MFWLKKITLNDEMNIQPNSALGNGTKAGHEINRPD